MSHLEEFQRGYLRAALWSSTDTHPQTGEDVSLDDGDWEWAEGAEEEMNAEAASFFAKHRGALELYAERISYDPSKGTPYDYAGHDLWLTRNGHGAGFWDRGLGELGKRLASYCGWGTEYSEVYLYLGDDLKIHIG